MTDTINLAGLKPTQFLKQYWQKSPLLIKNALTIPSDWPETSEILGLACEERIQSRLILQNYKRKDWDVRYGPFTAKDFKKLPKNKWTLLVQDVDKLIPSVANLMEKFKFLPSWRLDDVMISFSTDQGSVGAHVDNYDVFLIQGAGKKNWKIDSKKVENERFVPGLELKILEEFKPSDEWTLEPGDMLYLPPGIAHHGVAIGDSTTYSVGFRAPTHNEVLHSLIEWAGFKGDARYEDPDLKLQKEPGLISDDTIKKVAEIIAGIPRDQESLAKWFGEFITSPSHDHPPQPLNQEITAAELKKLMQTGATLRRDEGTRLAFRKVKKQTLFFVNGKILPLLGKPQALSAILSRQSRFSLKDLQKFLDDRSSAKILAQLVNEGVLYLDSPSS